MSKDKWIFMGVFFILVIIFVCSLSCYYAGRNAERAANQQQLADAEQRWDSERKQLEQTLGDAQTGIAGVTSGLGKAIDLATRATDRSIRIAILIDGIDEALRKLGVLTDE